MSGKPFLSGIVEGFYGRQWSWTDRRGCAEFLAGLGLNSYLYCPKGDPFLRKQWAQNWPDAELGELKILADTCAGHGLNFGVGLSPYALYEDYSAPARRQLKHRLGQIDEIGGVLLAILFDDMPGELTGLAHRQAQIVNDVMHWSTAGRVLVCPTYYSLDSRLEQFFGARPQNYWEQLGQLLPEQVDILWTGNEVCSESIRCADIENIARLLRRRPMLWDNYPVNDGEQGSNFLHLRPLSQRDAGLTSCCSGHLCNPMNQAWLSRAGLLGLARLYATHRGTISDIFGSELAAQLQGDTVRFQDRGLHSLDAGELLQLKRSYAQFQHPAALEVLAWLKGEYRFDPACLTG